MVVELLSFLNQEEMQSEGKFSISSQTYIVGITEPKSNVYSTCCEICHRADLLGLHRSAVRGGRECEGLHRPCDSRTLC